MGLFLLEVPQQGEPKPSFFGDDCGISTGYPLWNNERVYISQTSFFHSVSQEAYNFRIGKYFVLQKWLKDRRKRVLKEEDVQHYQNIKISFKRSALF